MRYFSSTPSHQVTGPGKPNVHKGMLRLIFSVSGQWTDWTDWSPCNVVPLDRTRKFSNRTRTCVCNNCNNYCIGKDIERKICSCAVGYIWGENKLLPCKPCLQVRPAVGNQGMKINLSALDKFRMSSLDKDLNYFSSETALSVGCSVDDNIVIFPFVKRSAGNS